MGFANNGQPAPHRRGRSPSIMTAHREVARRQRREAMIYDKDGRRRRGTVRKG